MPARRTLLLVLLLLASSASAQWRRDGAVVPDEPWRRADGAFGAMLLLTQDPEDFIAQWERPSAPGHAPGIRTVAEARRGDVVAAMVLFQGCAADASGSCRAEVDFQVLRPDGREYGAQQSATLWRGPPAPEGSLQLSRDRLAFRIEPEDPIGTWRIHAVVRDRVAQRTLHLVQPLDVAPAENDPAEWRWPASRPGDPIGAATP